MKEITIYDVHEHIWSKVFNAKKTYFENLGEIRSAIESNAYCTVVGVVSCYLAGNTRKILIETEEGIYKAENLFFSDALYEALKLECDITIKRSLLNELEEYINENKNYIVKY